MCKKHPMASGGNLRQGTIFLPFSVSSRPAHIHKTLHVSIMCSRHSNLADKCLPDIVWCRKPFLEALNDIRDTS